MKTIFNIMLVLSLIFFTNSCGNNDANTVIKNTGSELLNSSDKPEENAGGVMGGVTPPANNLTSITNKELGEE